MLNCNHLFYAILIRRTSDRKRKIWEKSKNRKDRRMFTLELRIIFLYVCVCVCVDYISVLLCVVAYMIVCVCVYVIIHALRDRFAIVLPCEAKRGGSRETIGGFVRIIFLLRVVMI